MRLVPMTPERYLAWVPVTIAGFATQQTASGTASEREARAYAERQFDRLLPQGLLTPEHHLWSAYDGPDEVGYLWLRVSDRPEGVEGYVYDVAVNPGLRGRGLGRAIMLAAEDVAAASGATSLWLNVFGHNRAARRLYDRLGYETVRTQLTRRLDGTDPLMSPDGPSVRLEAAGRVRVDGYRERRAYHNDREVGRVWWQRARRSDGLHADGFGLVVREELRRHGYGRAIIAAAERLCREHGVVAIGCDVPGDQAAAQALFDRMGFQASAVLMRKPLSHG